MNFIFECSTRYRAEHEKIKFTSTSGHVIFCLLYKHTNNDVFDDFPKISDHFPKIFQNCSEGQTNVSEHFPKISEDFRRLPRQIRLCFDHSAFSLSDYHVSNHGDTNILTRERFIRYLPAGRSVWWKTVTEVLKMLPEAAGRGQHFQARGHSFSLYGPTLSRQITYLFFSCGKLAYKWVCLRNFAIELAYVPPVYQTIRKKSNKRTNE